MLYEIFGNRYRTIKSTSAGSSGKDPYKAKGKVAIITILVWWYCGVLSIAHLVPLVHTNLISDQIKSSQSKRKSKPNLIQEIISHFTFLSL